MTSRTLEIEQAKQEILQVLGRTSECRDDETGQHTVRVGQMAEEIAAELGLPPHEVALIKFWKEASFLSCRRLVRLRCRTTKVVDALFAGLFFMNEV